MHARMQVESHEHTHAHVSVLIVSGHEVTCACSVDIYCNVQWMHMCVIIVPDPSGKFGGSKGRKGRTEDTEMKLLHVHVQYLYTHA